MWYMSLGQTLGWSDGSYKQHEIRLEQEPRVRRQIWFVLICSGTSRRDFTAMFLDQ